MSAPCTPEQRATNRHKWYESITIQTLGDFNQSVSFLMCVSLHDLPVYLTCCLLPLLCKNRFTNGFSGKESEADFFTALKTPTLRESANVPGHSGINDGATAAAAPLTRVDGPRLAPPVQSEVGRDQWQSRLEPLKLPTHGRPEMSRPRVLPRGKGVDGPRKRQQLAPQESHGSEVTDEDGHLMRSRSLPPQYISEALPESPQPRRLGSQTSSGRELQSQ